MLYKSILNFLRRSGSKLSAPRIQRLRAGFRLLDNRLTPSPVGLFPSSTIHRVSESGGGPLRARALVATEDGEDNPVPEGRRQDYAEAMRGERTTPPGRPKKNRVQKMGRILKIRLGGFERSHPPQPVGGDQRLQNMPGWRAEMNHRRQTDHQP